jgi:hypothetical protein
MICGSSEAPTGSSTPAAVERSQFVRRILEWTPELLFIAVTTAAGIWAGGRWLDPTGDPGIWWSLAERMAHGQRCYRDFYLQYGPLSPYLFFVSGKPFDYSYLWFNLVNWVPAILAGVLLSRASRPFFSFLERLVVVGLLLGLSIFAPGPARLVLPYSPAAVHALALSVGAFLLMQSRKRELPRAWGAGMLAGLAFCAKQEIGIAAMIALSAPLLTRGTRGLAWVTRSVAGFLAIALLGAAVVLGSGASPDSLRLDSHIWPLASVPREWKGLFRIAAGMTEDWRDSVALSARHLTKLILLGSLGALILAREKKRSRWAWTIGLLALLTAVDVVEGRSLLPEIRPVNLSMLVAFLVAILAWLDRERPNRDFLVGFGLFAGLVGVRTAFSGNIAVPYAGVSHFAASLTWALFFLCLLPVRFPGGVLSARRARTVWAALLFPVALYVAVNGIQQLRVEGRRAISTSRGAVFLGPRMARIYGRVSGHLHPGERALYLPETLGLDVLLKVEDASPLLIHTPGWLDSRAEEALIRRFEIRAPDVIVILDRGTAEFGVAPFGRGFGLRLAAWIGEHYQPTMTSPSVTVLRPARTPLSSVPVF